jgi:hypothetical protein
LTSLIKKNPLNQLGSNVCDRSVNHFFTLLLLIGIFISSESIRAQIGNIYDESNGQIAGINALMSAVTSNDVDGVRFFSKAGAALINQKNFGGATSLHIASREKNSEIAKILIDNGADVNAVDNEGWTPLMRAALSGSDVIINLLLDKGAKASAINSIGESAIIHATSSDCTNCLNAMFEKFNFINAMEISALKEQLTDAFVIARNRENQGAQALLESYLDRVIKMSPLLQRNYDEIKTVDEKIIDDGATKKSIEKAEQKSIKRIFKIVSPDGVLQTTEEKIPMIVTPQEDERAAVQKESSDVAIQDLSKVSDHPKSKKFKFVSGAEKQSVEPANPVKIEKKEVPKITEIKKLEPKVKTFKFNQGPSGQAVQAQPEVVTPISEPVKQTPKPRFKFTQGPNDIEHKELVQ